MSTIKPARLNAVYTESMAELIEALRSKLLLYFEDKETEQAWSAYIRNSARRFQINFNICALYLVGISINSITGGYINVSDLPGVAVTGLMFLLMVLMLSFKHLRSCMMYAQDLMVAATVSTWVCLVLGGIQACGSDWILWETADNSAVVFALTALVKLPKSVILAQCLIFIVLSGIIWSVTEGEQYQGVVGFEITFGYIKIMATGLFASVVDDAISREMFALACTLNRSPDHVDLHLLGDVRRYFSEVRMDTGEFIFSFYRPFAAIYKEPSRKKCSLRTWWHDWIDLRFTNKDLEAEYRIARNPKAIQQHLITTVINVASAVVPLCLSILDQAFNADATTMWTAPMQLVYFPVVLTIPTLLLVLRSVRSSAMAVQMIILFTSVANIVGWTLSHFAYILTDNADGPVSIPFHKSLAAVAVSIISASAQSGLLSMFYIPILLLLTVLNAGSILLLSDDQFTYEITSIPEVCMAAYFMCINSEYESRRWFLIKKLEKHDNPKTSPTASRPSPVQIERSAVNTGDPNKSMC
ncbi:uncharacterized protein BJ171DRAFT_599267 [Polychytrium aggregatum]|uniref:uncharacterized protein n=1 Tax=Polychytrium aggregatum TaxID=110093 RepID=UPI0022FE4B0F|nr:uncharacterized protein BJ171DRAFT_599267 [Polychytrium aggregatum]KAI9204474.1 hypothetical protein BJ171DRAFT_599267 [Polychytrium aggregatum]